ncbi:MAG: C13 family peptidase [Candidatus Thorarchaeota archaeon]
MESNGVYSNIMFVEVRAMPTKGKSKRKSERPTALILLVLVLAATNVATLAYFVVLDNSVPFENVPLSIADVTGDNNENLIGTTLSVTGYLVRAAGNFLLVANPLSYFNNSLDSRNHIMLTGSVPETLEDHLGFQITVKGILEVYDPSDGTSGMSVDSFFDVYVDLTIPGSYDDVQMVPYPMVEAHPWDFVEYDSTEEKYAVLYSGGIKPGKDYYRYWNDIIYMYFILQMHGYSSSNIYVIYKDGVAEDQHTPVHYPATHDSMDTVFGILDDEMGARDTLFFYTTNHGGGGGIAVWNPMATGGALTHSQVSNWLDAITCNNMIIVMEQCVSGKFISHLSAVNRVILTACKDDESSFACDTEGNWDEFVYHFMCALISYSFHAPLSTVDADYNNDGLISMKEAFIYAALSDSRGETPWYNDNGNGQGYNVLQAAFGLPGSYGEGIFL